MPDASLGPVIVNAAALPAPLKLSNLRNMLVKKKKKIKTYQGSRRVTSRTSPDTPAQLLLLLSACHSSFIPCPMLFRVVVDRCVVHRL